MRAPISVGLAIFVGFVVLLGYFFPNGILQNLRLLLVEWAGILAAVALLVGISNLYYVHWLKISSGHVDRFYSIVLVVSLTVTIILVGWFGPVHRVSMWIFNYIQVPIESSFMALLAVILVYLIIRMLRRRFDHFAFIFTITAIITLAASSLLLQETTILGDLRTWISQVPAVAGARGILIGMVLGIIATGLRILIGSDRPYDG
ncbi:MAG: hypothetical protein ACNA8H_04955 [Anaerolineales bacterium]